MLTKLPQLVKPLVPDDFREMIEKIEDATLEAAVITIVSDAQVDAGSAYIKLFKTLKKELEKVRKSIVEKRNKELKIINQAFKDIFINAEREQKRLEDELKSYMRKQEELAEMERKEEQDELEQQLITEAEIFDDESVLDNIPQTEIKRTKLSDKTSHLTSRREKRWRLVDFDKVPREYLFLNEKLINAVREQYGYTDESPIDGIEFFVENVAVLK